MAMKRCRKCGHWFVESAGHLCEQAPVQTTRKKARGLQTPILNQVGVIRVQHNGYGNGASGENATVSVKPATPKKEG